LFYCSNGSLEGASGAVIHEFPDDCQLIGFFEAEPAILDPGTPWLYNTLDFTTTRDGIEVHARLAPSYGELTVRLVLARQELALFELREAEAFRIISERQREALVATFAPKRKLDDFVLQLKPHVRVAWGNLQFA
jgi:hypothetical protein